LLTWMPCIIEDDEIKNDCNKTSYRKWLDEIYYI
jgi:hypothetical protein